MEPNVSSTMTQMASPVPLTILIIGNGVAGPILAMSLQKTNSHKIILVDSGPEEAPPIGAALGIAPNGLCALKFIGAEHVVLDKGGRLDYMAVRRGDTNAVLMDQPTADLFVEKFGFAGYGIVRQEYCAALRALAKERGIDMRFNMRLTTIEEKNGVVSAHFNDGEILKGDLLVGCDGIHSPTRAYVVGSDVKPDFANASVVIGLSKLSKEEEEAAKLTRGGNMFLGTEANVGLFPADSDGTWVWFCAFHTPDPAGGETAWGNDHSVEQLTKLASSKIEGWRVTIPSMMLSKTLRCFAIPLYDRPPLERWHKGNVVLCGDGAHPTTPVGGQGSQMAAESAVILARLLADNAPSDELFKRYTTLRRPRTDAVSMNSRKTLNNMLASGVWRMVRDFVITVFGGYFFRSGMMGHYGYDAGTAAL